MKTAMYGHPTESPLKAHFWPPLFFHKVQQQQF